MVFHSPLLANLRRAGAEDASPQSPAASEDDFLRRRRTPGGAAERPLNRPTTFGNNAPHRPSPLGLAQPTATGSTGPSTSSTTAPKPTTTTTTGTNFKARLLAMQSGQQDATTTSSTTTHVWSRPSAGLARPGQLAPIGLAPRISPAALDSSQGASPHFSPHSRGATPMAGAGGAPPVSTLEDELRQLHVQERGGDEAIHELESPLGSPNYEEFSSEVQGTPATPIVGLRTAPSEAPMTSQSAYYSAYSAFPASKGGPSPSPTFWTPILGSTQKKGGKAFGAGALAVARSAAPLTAGAPPADSIGQLDAVKGTQAPPETAPLLSGKQTIERKSEYKHQFEAFGTSFSSPSSSIAGSPVKRGETTSSKTLGEYGALRVLRRLRAELPDYLPGVTEWTPPGQETATATAPPAVKLKPSMSGADALKELASLRSAALSKLDNSSSNGSREEAYRLTMPSSLSYLTTTMGAPSRGTSTSTAASTADNKEQGFDACRGFPSAFATAIKQDSSSPFSVKSLTAGGDNVVPVNAVSSPANTTTNNIGIAHPSPWLLKKVSQRSGAGVGGGTGRHGALAKGVEERLERLKLLRDQASKVNAMEEH